MRAAHSLPCDDGNGRILYREDIEFTDFPLPEVTLYFTNHTILLSWRASCICRAAISHLSIRREL